MGTVDRLAGLLPDAAEEILFHRKHLREVRLRAGRRAQLVHDDGESMPGGNLDASKLGEVLSELLEHSLYAREAELAEGFFTLEDGARVGVCGRLVGSGKGIAAMTEIGSLCVRVARALPGCADALLPLVEGPRSLLVVSPPGLGKTTCLRELARKLSESGLRVGIADERHELAACHRGVPGLDVGPRTDVMDGGPKALAIPRILRAMAPQVIVTDEIGGPEDDICLAEAVRCGVAVVASAHGADLQAILSRPALAECLRGGIFESIALLGPRPGAIKAIYQRKKGADGAWSYG